MVLWRRPPSIAPVLLCGVCVAHRTPLCTAVYTPPRSSGTNVNLFVQPTFSWCLCAPRVCLVLAMPYSLVYTSRYCVRRLCSRGSPSFCVSSCCYGFVFVGVFCCCWCDCCCYGRFCCRCTSVRTTALRWRRPVGEPKRVCLSVLA